MNTISTFPSITFTPPVLLRRLWASNRLLALATTFYFLLFVSTIALSVVDKRLITGAPAWFKPMKFTISAILYTGTLAWILSFAQPGRLVKLVSGVTAVAFVVELAVIFLQAARGMRSHFNVATSLDSTLFSLMGMFVMLIWAMNLLAAVLLLRQRLPDQAFAWSLRLALLVTAVGAGLGFIMTTPTPEQLVAMQSGQRPTFIGAHNVGVEDGGPGLPFTGWSTEGGDVRIPHFVGLHALQVVPLAGILINRRWNTRLNQQQRTVLVGVVGLGYLGLVLLLLWQALRGQPVIAPDAITLLALVALVGVSVTAAAAVFRMK